VQVVGNMRTTSKIAYKEISEDGTRNRQKQNILTCLYFSIMPMSLREIQKETGYDINAISGRCAELKKDNKIFEFPKRKCSITGRLVTPVWSKSHYEGLF